MKDFLIGSLIGGILVYLFFDWLHDQTIPRHNPTPPDGKEPHSARYDKKTGKPLIKEMKQDAA